MYLARYAALRVNAILDAAQLEYPLLPQDLADSREVRESPERMAITGARPRIAWLAIPPGPGSGGHTTQFRMMESARAVGFDNTLLFYDRHNGDFDHYAHIVRTSWPWLVADIHPVEAKITGFDAVVATSWPTAHVLARRGVEGKRIYFIQDYEPYFMPRGSEYAYAEDSYRFGFRNIALGNMVHDLLASELGVTSDLVPFGCDTQTYRLEPHGPRSGIVFYAKRGNDRRGYQLAMRALELFHSDHPNVPIHAYGEVVTTESFPVVNHGSVSPDQLNLLYNSVIAGLALSFTNISLVAEELLAAGVVPIINDTKLARADLANPYAVWANATPRALADALGTAVTHPARDSIAAAAAATVVGRSWGPTGRLVATVIAEEVGARLVEGRQLGDAAPRQ
ncbi:hypothetical protein GCM10009776_14920 [Microbacterium deminutum]|uniref:Glycosyltransferase family 1 protein n=2 Tax=Microbacterium deminutum TaxID=344164 RepID=A0ABN2QKB7_9MICO